jgi:hypothetical protein
VADEDYEIAQRLVAAAPGTELFVYGGIEHSSPSTTSRRRC